ncbi:MAG: ABC transporter substrate-binding protein, partial [Leptolyngbya sp. SIO4C5]|nr:ABC transporter substrate-binding protein [Leptolyngbya sp. SIO4C5]
MPWLALTVGAISACQGRTNRATVNSNASSPQSAAPTDCRTIQHELGETEVCGQPQNVVVLGPYLLEPLLALGVQPTAFADHETGGQRDYDHPSQQIPYLGRYITQPVVNVGTAGTPSIESILKVQPDLILGTEWNANEYETFSNIAPTLLVKWAEPEMALRAIAQAVNRTEQAEQILIETEQRIAAAREDFAPVVSTHPKLLLLSSRNFQDMYLGNSGHGMCSSLLVEIPFPQVG